MADPQDLDEDERLRFRLALHNVIWGLWSQYEQAELTGVSGQVWESTKPILWRMVGSPGGQWFWSGYKHEFAKSFVRGKLVRDTHKNLHCPTVPYQEKTGYAAKSKMRSE